MRFAAVLLLAAGLSGCASLNSKSEPNRSSSEMSKPCSCPGDMTCCGHDAEGRLCCTPESCTCKHVTSR